MQQPKKTKEIKVPKDDDFVTISSGTVQYKTLTADEKKRYLSYLERNRENKNAFAHVDTPTPGEEVNPNQGEEVTG